MKSEALELTGSFEQPSNLLNLGCGRRFHRAWTNVDFFAYDPMILPHDLTTGLPFDDGRFDVVYHSHVLEHFSRPAGRRFLAECRRVLRPGGLLRVVVPDLEKLANRYLAALNRAGDEASVREDMVRLDWCTLQLLDQCVRIESGGELMRFLERHRNGLDPKLRDEILSTSGTAVEMWAGNGIAEARAEPGGERSVHPNSVASWRLLAGRLREWRRSRRAPLSRAFESSGEKHLWMYDRVSLAELLRSLGFGTPQVCAAHQSAVNGWAKFGLDTDDQQAVRKPDSLFMEAVRA